MFFFIDASSPKSSNLDLDDSSIELVPQQSATNGGPVSGDQAHDKEDEEGGARDNVRAIRLKGFFFSPLTLNSTVLYVIPLGRKTLVYCSPRKSIKMRAMTKLP